MAGHMQTSMSASHDAHAKPPPDLRDAYKRYQKLHASMLHAQTDLISFDQPRGEQPTGLTRTDLTALPSELRRLFIEFVSSSRTDVFELDLTGDATVFEINELPGLMIYPSLFPPSVQLSLLDKLLHRNLSNPQHRTNVHLHHHVPYPPGSFFARDAFDLVFVPKDASMHKSISTSQFLNKKLRWMTLGGQYDWTKKVYPSTAPPAFPLETKRLIEGVFPMRAEAAIVNLYSPGDTLSLHRDVSEECNRPLVSVSLGCDAIFMVGLEGRNPIEKPRLATIRLRSGDAVLMSGESRYAWHAVPKVIEGTCPDWMRDWPRREDADGTTNFDGWTAWMAGKRVNLNIRQMFS